MNEKVEGVTTSRDSRGTVLVVDDPDLADRYTLWLEASHEVRTAYSGQAALDALTPTVDLVIVGCRPSFQGGEGVVAGIEDRGVDCAIAMVATEMGEATPPGLPVDAFLFRPVTKPELVQTTAELLSVSATSPSNGIRAGAGEAPGASETAGGRLRSDGAAPASGMPAATVEEASTSPGESGPPDSGAESSSVGDMLMVFRKTNRILADADCREEAASALCTMLTEEIPYEVACFGEYTESFGTVTLTACDRTGTEPAVTPQRFDVDTDGPIARAVSENTVVRHSSGDARGLQSIFEAVAVDRPAHQIVVPVRHGETVYGVLALGRTAPGIAAGERTLLADLGVSIGDGIDAIESKRLLVADTATTLEFEVADRGDLFVDCSAAHDCRFVLRGVTPAGEDTVTCYVHATGVGLETVREDLGGRSAVSCHRVVDDCGETLVLEVTVRGHAVVRTLTDASAKVVEFVAERGTADVSVEVAACVDCRTVMEAVERRFPDTDLRAKRTDQSCQDSPERFGTDLRRALTERQQTILATAYNAGYFVWPRDSTAEEVAEAVDLAPPTLHEHIRDAERKLLEVYFEHVDAEGLTSQFVD